VNKKKTVKAGKCLSLNFSMDDYNQSHKMKNGITFIVKNRFLGGVNDAH